MKKLLIVLAVVLFTVGFANKVSAQLVTKSNSAGGEIVAPITLTSVNKLEFGRIATGTVAGSVVLTPAAAPGITYDVVLAVPGGATRSAASYDVTGTGGYKYAISVPTGSITLAGSAAGTSMTVSGFNALSVGTPNTTGGTLTTGGTDVFYVGGTLNVGASQAAGVYSGTFNVSVNYN